MVSSRNDRLWEAVLKRCVFPSIAMPSLVVLNCLVYGDSVNHIFSVEISKDATFADLKNVISRRPRFSHVVSEKLELRKVDVHRDALPKFVSSGAPATLGEEVGPLYDIQEVFSGEINRKTSPSSSCSS